MGADGATTDVKAGGAKCVLPVGSFEQHRDYLPLITDTVVTERTRLAGLSGSQTAQNA
jgi:creatinine amidohydrolase/Fe(II)-dependent formamide hydrolase-like protein